MYLRALLSLDRACRIMLTEAIHHFGEKQGNEEQGSLKKLKREIQTGKGDVLSEKKELINISSSPDKISTSVSLKSTSLAENEGGDSESEAACTIS